ncbi:MAG: hypothetical protein LBU88_02620 [Treponema sp.]|jgi:hypothetical protein|nr:hypothetical protein [Treponema sp.]
MKLLPLFLLFFVFIFSACNRDKVGSARNSAENIIDFPDSGISVEPAEEEQEMEAIEKKSFDYNKILTGDLSDFIGYWVNNNNEKRDLVPSGLFGGGVQAHGFEKTKRGSYFWNVTADMGGFGVELFPIGVEAVGARGIVPTDTTKVRMHSGHEPPFEADQIFYLEIAEYYTLANGTMADTRIPKYAANLIIKRFEAIENGDIAAFRSTLPEPGDAPDIYRNLLHIYLNFADFFDVDYDAFTYAVAEADGLDEIMHTAFSRNFPLKSRNTGQVIKKIEFAFIDNFRSTNNQLVRVITTNNKKEEVIYYLTFYGNEDFAEIGTHF